MSSTTPARPVNRSWTRRLARAAVRPLLGSGVTPNHITFVRLATAVASLTLLALGEGWSTWAGAGFWLVSAFLDRCDGEFARMSGLSSRFGHMLDYWGDVLTNALFFLAMGISLREEEFPVLGTWGWLLTGFVATLAVGASGVLADRFERRLPPGKKVFDGALGFDFDDVLYLFAAVPLVGLAPFVVVGAALGAPLYAAWMVQKARSFDRRAADRASQSFA
ncbi:CDP-alcohol phosphatidyltransferase family protein [Zavarzinia sp. CC-PAN008]|uniref:CDP-alcohol phosphatidyltransferase family protein n=1 Tax=Zavarzinia sp. CC-PAN008 TaxID=3243332 RepID=UPI003F7428B8